MMFSNRDLRKLIVPLVVESVLSMLVGMSDTVMVSAAGEAALSGVSIVNEVNTLMIVIFTSLSSGGAVIVSQYLGAKDEEKARLAGGQLVQVATCFSLFLGVLCAVFNRELLGLLYGSIEADVMECAREYLIITALSFPFLGLYNACSALFRSRNETRITMHASVIMNAINVVGNAIGVFVLHLGVAGVAYPTLISRAVAALVLLISAFRDTNNVHLTKESIFTFHKDTQKKILSIAVPNAIENGLFQLGRVLVTSIVTGFGTTQIAANGAANSIATMLYLTDNAMELAIVTVIGHCVGANDYEQAHYYMVKMVKIAMAMAWVSSGITFIVLKPALSLFGLNAEGNQLVTQIILSDCIATGLLHSVAFVLSNGIRAAGDARYTMVCGVLSMFCARLFGSYILGSVLGLGVYGTWLATFLDWLVRIVCFSIRYKSDAWTKFRTVEQ